jgi:hypothetical protein
MDVMSFSKMVPAAIGVAGLLMLFMMRARRPASDHELVIFLLNVRSTLLLLGCVALILLSVWLIRRPPPPDRDIGPEWGAGGRDGLVARQSATDGIDTTRAASARLPS